MRVCLVAFQFYPSVGGAQTQAEKLARQLQQLGHEVVVVTLRHQKAWPARETYSTFPVIRVGGWYRHRGKLRVGRLGHLCVDMLLFLTLWHLRESYDLIHTLQLSPLAAIATLIGKLTHKPVIVGIQSTGPYTRPGNHSSQQAHTLSGETEKGSQHRGEAGGDIAALQKNAWGGHRILNYLRESDVYYQILSSRSYISLIQHGFRPERLVYIPNGVDTQQFYPSFRQRYRDWHVERMLLCVARLEYAKGIDVLLQAWSYMLKLPLAWRDDLQPRLCLVGDGTQREVLEQLAAELGIQESVDFLGTRHDIAWLLREAWGFVLPSRWEGMPNALLEAMASALPCVVTRVSGSEDIIEQGSNGLLVEPEQPEQLAYALRLLLEDANLAHRLGWRGYETVLNYYRLDATVQSCLTLYRYLLSRNIHNYARQSVKQDTTRAVQTLQPDSEEWRYWKYDK
ncbi:MAG TPA: glycosyltransferase family 4 protein [Ktedonobacteraceae bacterium]|nr:glycosyltransferase family 4 protein [Ktedonobacteraceae bacterium]